MNQAAALTVGTVVLLIDGHGCHCLHRIDEWDDVSADSLRLGAETWHALLFVMDTKAQHWCPVLRARAPAIGIVRTYHRLYLPHGWRSPHARWPVDGAAVPSPARLGLTARCATARRVREAVS